MTPVTSSDTTYTYLALGDSYTIGEAVDANESFPAQTIKLLNSKTHFSDPVIIAKTGWTTDELIDAISERKLDKTFDFVTLLIGVNNQYRGRDTANYREEFTKLLDIAIKFASHNTSRVIVVSIPDWGVTPFGEKSGRDQEQISREIDAYNQVAKEITEQKGIIFIDITPASRNAKEDHSLLASDGLHPGPKMYANWAKLVSEKFSAQIK